MTALPQTSRCRVPDCNGTHKARGYCKNHYLSVWRKGGLPPVTKPSVSDRFWSRVKKTSTCWEWVGTFNRAGYGVITVDGKQARAHRMAYEMVIGPIPDGRVLDHLCRNRICVNPAHLEPVTDAENILRGFAPPAINARQATCALGHELEVVQYANRVQRLCKRCAKARRAARWKSKRAATTNKEQK